MEKEGTILLAAALNGNRIMAWHIGSREALPESECATGVRDDVDAAFCF